MTTLLTTADIAEQFGVTRQYATNRLVRMVDFPAPKYNISQQTRRWLAADVDAWKARQHPDYVEPPRPVAMPEQVRPPVGSADGTITPDVRRTLAAKLAGAQRRSRLKVENVRLVCLAVNLMMNRWGDQAYYSFAAAAT